MTESQSGGGQLPLWWGELRLGAKRELLTTRLSLEKVIKLNGAYATSSAGNDGGLRQPTGARDEGKAFL